MFLSNNNATAQADIFTNPSLTLHVPVSPPHLPTAPDTRYTVWLHAKTGKHEGDSSETLSFRTDVGGPSEPLLTNVTCRADTSILVRWRRPRQLRGSIDFYYVMFRGEYDSDLERVQIETDAEVTEDQVGVIFFFLSTNILALEDGYVARDGYVANSMRKRPVPDMPPSQFSVRLVCVVNMSNEH